MFYRYPKQSELMNRIKNQLSWHETPDTVALLWRGYLAALFEWGLVDIQAHSKLTKLLPQIGLEELEELFLDKRACPEQASEIMNGKVSSQYEGSRRTDYIYESQKVYITRKERWNDAQGPEIELLEWEQYIKNDAEMQLVSSFDRKAKSGSIIRVSGEGIGVWEKFSQAHMHPCYVEYSKGMLIVRDINQEILSKMHQIAKKLNAKVVVPTERPGEQ